MDPSRLAPPPASMRAPAFGMVNGIERNRRSAVRTQPGIAGSIPSAGRLRVRQGDPHMAETKTLARFTAKQAGEGFTLRIEDAGGDTLELAATRDQLDVIADALDDLLADTEEDDATEDEDEDEEDTAGAR
jgi:hypothetical protein